MEEIRLFRMPTGFQTSIRLQPDGTWSLVVDRFFEGEPWTERDRCVYELLALSECADVMLQELFSVRP